MRTAYQRVDRWLMLHHPRLWTIQPHAALLLALPVYALMTIGTLIARFAVTPTVRRLSAGTYESPYLPTPPFGLADQFVDSQIVSWSIAAQQARITQTFVMITLATLVFSVIASALWVRRCAAQSVESRFGRSRWKDVWTEVAVALACALVLGGPVAWVALLVSPTPAQLGARAALDTLSRTEIRRLAGETTRYVEANGVTRWDRLAELSDKRRDWNSSTLTVLRPQHIDIDATYSRSAKTVAPSVDLQINAKSTDAAAYLQTVADAVYAVAFEKFSGLSVFLIEACRNVLWPFSAGLTCLILFLLKRAPTRYVVVTVLVAMVLVPLGALFINMIGILGLSLYINTSRVSSPVSDVDLVYLPTIISSISYGIQFVILISIALVGQRTAVRKRGHLLATLALPFAIAHGIWLLLVAITTSEFNRDFGQGLSSDPEQVELRLRQLLLAATLLPFYWLAIMPLLDRSLRRLMALPTE
jgi:hypothetical protein